MSKKIILSNGKEVTTATKEQIVTLDAKSANFESDVTPLQSGDVITFDGEIVSLEYNKNPYGALTCKILRDGETLQGLVSKSSIQAMALTSPNPEIGTEKFAQINSKLSGFAKISELAIYCKDKTFAIEKTEDLFRVADWIDSKTKKDDGTFKKEPKTFINPQLGTTHILTKAKDFNILKLV